MLTLLTVLLASTPCPAPGSNTPAVRATCAQPADSAEALIEQASARMDAGAWREALALLEAPAAQGAGPATHLLRGICHYELGEDAAATRQLEAARADPELTPSADLFLGLIAQRRGDADAAARAFERVHALDTGELGSVAGTLFKRARREGRLSLALALGAGYDSNPLLSAPGLPRASDAAGHASVALSLRPWGQGGPYARAALSGRRQAQLRGIDLGVASAGAGWQSVPGALRLGVDYGWDGMVLGSVPFLTAHQLTGSAGWYPGAAGLEASYSFRLDTFHPAVSAGYSGSRHAGGVDLVYGAGDWLHVRLGYGTAQAATAAPELAHLEHGPHAGLTLRLGQAARLGVEGRWLRRQYASARRADGQLDGLAALEVDLHTRWLLRAELSAIQVRSTLSSQDYTALSGGLSLRYLAAFL